MRDTFGMGVIAGLIGGLVGIVFSHTLFLLGVTSIASLHLAAALVVNDIFNLTAGGVFWSVVAHFSIAASFGVLMALVIRYSGRDYWVLKAVILGALVCMILHSYLMPILRPDIDFRPTAAEFGTMVVTHSLISLVATYIIVKYYRHPVKA
jgi:hypothetical protein